MKIRKMLSLLEILCVTTLFSVGFSSWVVVEDNTVTPTASVKVDTVFNNNDYLTIKNVMFSDYSATGFYTDFVYSETTGLEAKLAYDIVFDYEKYKTEYISNATSLKFDITLGYSQTVIEAIDIIYLSDCVTTLTYSLDSATAKTATISSTITKESTNSKIDFSTTIEESTSFSLMTLHCEHTFTFADIVAVSNFCLNLIAQKGLPLKINALVEGN